MAGGMARSREQRERRRDGSDVGRANALRAAVLALLALLLAACSRRRRRCSARRRRRPRAAAAAPGRAAAPAQQREHQRILAAYGGAYDDPRLQAMLDQTVDKLVAASDRPDLRYRVTILNSPAVNAFALPTGQLYVTRGLIALANDNSELASVLSHEMAHVIARHAAIREDQARQAALVNRVVTDVLSDPQIGALALAKSKIALASFSRAQEFEADGIGVGISARAGFDPYGAERFLTSMGRNADLRAAARQHRPARARLPVLASGDARPREQRADQRAPVQRARRRRARQGRVSRAARRPGLRRRPERRLRARPALPASQARLHLHRAGRLRARQHRAGGARRQGRRRAGAAARRGARAGRADADRVSRLRLDREHRSTRASRTSTINGFPAATATAKGDQWTFRLYAVRFGSEVYRFIFAAKHRTEAVDRTFRESIDSFRRMTRRRDPAGAAAAAQGRRRCSRATPSSGSPAAWRSATGPSSASACSTGSAPNDKLKPGDQVKIVVE